MKQTPYIYMALLCTTLAAPFLAQAKGMPPSYQVFYSTSFADGAGPCADTQSVSLVDAPGGGSGKVAKISAARGDSFAGLDFSGCTKMKSGRDYMVTWTTYIPPDYLVDKSQPEEIFEIHQGSGSGTPPFRLSIHGDQYVADLSNGGRTEHYNVGPAGGMGAESGDKGYWVRWSLHYRPDASGKKSVTDLYKNDVLVLTANGVPNAYPQDNAAYLKAGIRKNWEGAEVTRRIVYFGDIAIGAKP